jgi:outer membrane protein assembly factor BamB
MLYAVDADNGALVWRFTYRPVEAEEMPAPAVVDGIVYYGSFGGTLFALDAATGEVRWKASVDGLTRYPVVAGGELYAIAGTTLWVFDAVTGEEHNHLEFLGLEVTPANFPGNVVSSPLVVDGTVYVGTDKGLLAIGGSE